MTAMAMLAHNMQRGQMVTTNDNALSVDTGKVALNVNGDAAFGFAVGALIGAFAMVILLRR